METSPPFPPEMEDPKYWQEIIMEAAALHLLKRMDRGEIPNPNWLIELNDRKEPHL